MNNPMEMIKVFMQKNNNPMMNNLIQMAQKGDTKGVENFARNLCKEKGLDFDKEFTAFMSQFKK